jgi:hypothetical protein
VVERLPPGVAIAHPLHPHAPSSAVDFYDFVEGARVDILLVAERLWRARDQCINVVDNLADVVGNPSGGV